MATEQEQVDVLESMLRTAEAAGYRWSIHGAPPWLPAALKQRGWYLVPLWTYQAPGPETHPNYRHKQEGERMVAERTELPLLVPLGALARLKERQAIMLDMLCEGSTNDEIARALFVSVATLKDMLESAREHLCARNRTHAAVVWMQVRDQYVAPRTQLKAIGNRTATCRDCGAPIRPRNTRCLVCCLRWRAAHRTTGFPTVPCPRPGCPHRMKATSARCARCYRQDLDKAVQQQQEGYGWSQKGRS